MAATGDRLSHVLRRDGALLVSQGEKKGQDVPPPSCHHTPAKPWEGPAAGPWAVSGQGPLYPPGPRGQSWARRSHSVSPWECDTGCPERDQQVLTFCPVVAVMDTETGGTSQVVAAGTARL